MSSAPDKHRAILPKDTPQPVARHTDIQRKNVSRACAACRASRTRCTAERPCRRCVAENIPCVLDDSMDGRTGRKRLLEELATKADSLGTILDSIRSSDDQSVQALLDLARNEHPTEELVQPAKGVLQRNELRGKSRHRLRQAVMDIASLVDDPPIHVSASPWTQVITDDEAISHLISVYFTWHHCAYPAVDQDLFVDAMQSKNSQFCSPLLVNSLCLVACNYTDHPSAFADPSDRSTRAAHFMNEVTRLWGLEQGRASLTSLQAFPSLISSAVFLGKDRVGALYTTQSIALAADLARHVKKSLKQNKKEYASKDFQRSLSLALWASFSIQSEVAVAWMKAFDLRPPNLKAPYEVQELATESLWQPYPKPDGVGVVFYPFAINTERFRLYTIAADLLPLVLSGNPQDSPLPGGIVLDRVAKIDRLGDMKKRLRDWYQDLHAGAKVEVETTPVPAGPLINLHLTYHGFYITTHSLILLVLDKADPDREAAEDEVISACHSIAGLFQCVQRTYGFTYFGVTYMHNSALCMFNLLDFLTRPGISEIFHIMIVVLSNISRRWSLARGLMKMVWITIQQRKLEEYLNATTLALFKLNAEDNWGPQDHRLFDMCAYPNYADIGEKGRDFVEMGELLQEYAELQLGARTEGPQNDYMGDLPPNTAP